VENKEKINLEEAFQNVLQSTGSVGDEELIRVATTYTRQISGYQMKLILFLLVWGFDPNLTIQQKVQSFIEKWLELKQYNNSANFVGRVLDSIALKRLITENSTKINIQKT
jgi:hypothetical protein